MTGIKQKADSRRIHVPGNPSKRLEIVIKIVACALHWRIAHD